MQITPWRLKGSVNCGWISSNKLPCVYKDLPGENEFGWVQLALSVGDEKS